MVLEVPGKFSSLFALGSTPLALHLSLLALELKLLALGLFARVALILTQVNSNPTQVEWKPSTSRLVDFGKSCLTNRKFFDTARHVFITHCANASSFVSTTSCLSSNASRLIIAEVDWKLMQVDCKMVFKLFYDSSTGHKFTKEAKMGQYWGFHYNFDEKKGLWVA